MSDESTVERDWNDAGYSIFSRLKNDTREYYVGDVDYIVDFHNPSAWSTSYDNCRPTPVFDDLQQSADLLRLVYDDYQFDFHKLTITKREDDEPLNEDNASLDTTHMVDSVGTDPNGLLSDKQSD